MIRPDPQIIWNTPKQLVVEAGPRPLPPVQYRRRGVAGSQKVPPVWKIQYGELQFQLKTMGFKHTGVFPEQAVNWDFTGSLIRNAKRPLKVLNLFAYTGGATLACAQAGASVCHVDASKGMVAWAKENAAASGLSAKPVRWLVDDCIKFVQQGTAPGKPLRRNYYGPALLRQRPRRRGLEAGGTAFFPCGAVPEYFVSRREIFFVEQLHHRAVPVGDGIPSGGAAAKTMGGSVAADEIGLPVTSTGQVLPCGSTAIWVGKDAD